MTNFRVFTGARETLAPRFIVTRESGGEICIMYSSGKPSPSSVRISFSFSSTKPLGS
jgi:hypothetical protein